MRNKLIRIFLMFIAMLLFEEVNANARTWYIKADGTGDAPTIQAGVDSSLAGDTVLVAPGSYSEIITIKQGICLKSELGASRTKLIIASDPDTYYAIYGENIEPSAYRTEINGFWVEGVKWGFLGAITLWKCENTWIINNILTGNRTGILFQECNPTIMNNTTYGNYEFGIEGGGGGALAFNIIWDRVFGLAIDIVNVGNDFLDLSDAYPYERNNFSLDPEFCGAEAGNFSLQSDSPCAPGNPPFASELIGALPVNCGTTSVEQKTWGEIKAIYAK